MYQIEEVYCVRFGVLFRQRVALMSARDRERHEEMMFMVSIDGGGVI